MENGDPLGWPLVYRRGYDFEGWFCTIEKEGRGNPVNQNDIVRETRDHTLFAHWKKNTYTITFDPNGDGATANPTTKEVIYDEPYGELAEAKKLGHTFSGWWTQPTSGTEVTAETIVTEETINPDDKFGNKLYAHWTPNTYTITYNSNGGTGTMEPTVVTYGQLTKLKDNAFEKSGYSFDGWYMYSPERDKWLYTIPSGHPEFREDVEQPAGVKKKKYNNGDGSATATPENGDTIVLVAQWKPNEYTVTFNANGGSGAPSNQTKLHGQDLTLSPGRPTRNGYDFVGWAKSSSATVAQYQPGETYTENSNVTLYAIWKDNEYTVTFNANGGTTPESERKVTYGETYGGVFPTPTRADYEFTGWYTERNGGTRVQGQYDTVNIQGDHTLYAHWVKKYTIRYNANGGSGAPSNQTKLHDQNLTLSSKSPTKAGHTFKGWANSASATVTQYLPGETYTENSNVTLYAVWKEVGVTGVTITPSTDQWIQYRNGSKVTFTATVSPSNAMNKNVKWYSSNPNVATVNNGIVTVKNPGQTKITVETEDGKKSDSINIYIYNLEIYEGKTIKTYNAYRGTYSWIFIDEQQITAGRGNAKFIIEGIEDSYYIWYRVNCSPSGKNYLKSRDVTNISSAIGVFYRN